MADQLNLIFADAYKKMSLALLNTAEELKLKLEEIIDQTVYANDPDWYTRADVGIRHLWEVRSNMNNMALTEMAICEIYPETSKIFHSMDLWQHGNNREAIAPLDLVKVLDEGHIWYGGNVFGFPDVPEYNFWGQFLEYVDKNFRTIFFKNCKKVGLPIEAIGHSSWGTANEDYGEEENVE